MDFNRLLGRVKSILLTPKTEWPVIAAEPATTAGIYTGYILLLAAVPALCQFLKLAVSWIQRAVPGTRCISAPPMRSKSRSRSTWARSSVPSWWRSSSTRWRPPSAARRTASRRSRSWPIRTPPRGSPGSPCCCRCSWAPLIMLIGLVYGIYLLYLGLPPTMKCPPEKAAGYTAVTLICAIIIVWLLFYVLGMVLGLRAGMGMAGMRHRTAATSHSMRNSPAGKLGQWAQGMAAAGKQLESAQKSGDAQAEANAVGQMMTGAVNGGQQVEALPPDRLKSFLPDTLGRPEAQRGQRRAKRRDGHAGGHGHRQLRRRQRRPLAQARNHRHGRRQGPAGGGHPCERAAGPRDLDRLREDLPPGRHA